MTDRSIGATGAEATNPLAERPGLYRALAAGGPSTVAELAERTGTAQRYIREWLEHAYGWSVMSCLPDAMGDPETAATGAVMRPATLREYARRAGFGHADVLPIETAYWRFYRLVP